ncbi:cadherin-like domain-containing protein, partial [Asticcacaulis sp. AC402]|uniref:cadherin-like domain-containing protein n=2 Tax=Asticcacaulis sp. AC402 TaxID=1282361 RepID=UPI0003C4045C
PTSPASLGSVDEDVDFVGSDEDLLAGWTDIDFERDEDDVLPALVVSDISVNNGTVTRDDVGGFTITPAANYNGTITVTYKVSDGTTEVTATRSLTVTPVADAPVYDEDEATELTGAVEDEDFAISTADLLDGFSDPDGATSFTITAISVDEGTIEAASGPSSSVANGYTYTPDADFYGEVTLTYTVSDGVNTTEVTKTFTVEAVNDAPRGDAATITGVTEDTPSAFTKAQLLADISDIDGGAVNNSIMGVPPSDLTVTAISATHGTFVYNADDDTYDFTPDENYNGEASITYSVSDGIDSAEFTSTFTIAAVNDAPEGEGATITGATEDEDLVLTTAQLLADISDVEDDDLTITDIEATHGTITYDEGTDSYTFTPDENYSGEATITYTVSDGEDTTEFTSNFTIAGANDDPTAPAAIDLGSVEEDTEIEVSVEDLLAGWTDIDGDTEFTVSNLSAGDGFTITLSDDETYYTVTAPDDYVGEIAFEYEVSDGNGGTGFGSATLDVTNVYDAPELDAPVELEAIDEDTTATVSTEDLLQGWSSADGLTLTLGEVTATNAEVTEEDGVYTITPDANFHGTVVISYTILDGEGDPVEATLDLTVNSVIDLVESDETTTLGATDEDLILTGEDDIDGTGNSLGNVLTGNDGANKLDGKTGNDTMYGGDGDDIYVVDSSSDVASEQIVDGVDDGGFDMVRSSATFTLGAYIEVLRLNGSANINGTGNSMSNYL